MNTHEAYRQMKKFWDGDKWIEYPSYYTQKVVQYLDSMGESVEESEMMFEDMNGIMVPSRGCAKRHLLPQIKSSELVADLDSNGIAHVDQYELPGTLFPTHAEFNTDKVLAIIASNAENSAPILVSKDGMIIDGHHRWLACVNIGCLCLAKVIDLTYSEFMKFIEGKPYVSYKSLHESVCDSKPANKPWNTPDGPKKFAVCGKNKDGNAKLVRFGDPNMTIKKHIPARRKSFRARHKCDTATDKTSARYWSCKKW